MSALSIFDNLVKKLQLSFSLLNRNNLSSNVVNLKDSSKNILQQAGGNINIVNATDERLSNEEYKIIHALYQRFIDNNRQPVRWKVADAHQEVGIVAGQYVGTINSSPYIRLDGNEYMLTNEGMRYMDNQSSDKN